MIATLLRGLEIRSTVFSKLVCYLFMISSYICANFGSHKDRVLRWNPQAITTCLLCKVETETRDHLLFECSYSKEVWKGVIGNLAGNGNGYSWTQVTQVVVNGMHERIPTFLLRYCFQAVVYVLWHERNVRRVGESSQSASCLITRIDKLVRNKITSLRKKNGGRYEKAMENWFGRT
ncbi:hypothetical protein F2Q69_00051355 [Brassica cretica]|uniref:Reverse transcriptase zinc-binding domain-containing protein n=1 Tax=Brassica cretica TaxID=69181 RepID=A0A8S9PRD2_BRACR|nr:hypothetical protein F2Q69_00051355 [Brassica cretica]